MNFIKYLPHFKLALITALVSIVFWFGFYFNIPGKIGFPNTTLETIFANYDGPNYMVISKCGYVKNCIATNFSLPQPLEYYPAHFPGYPLLIKYFSLYTTTPKAMLLTTLIGSVFLSLAMFIFFSRYLNFKTAYYLSILSIFFPGRMLVLRLVGAPETWFMALTLLSIILFQKKNYISAAVIASLSLILKSPGVLLFAAYLCMALFDWTKTHDLKNIVNKYLCFLVGPLVLLAIFYFYYLETGDFFAYFHSGDNFHLNLFPYMVFISNHTWINTIWLEDVLYIFIISYVALSRIFKKFKFNIIFVYPFLFTLASVFVAHRDISRYLAPAYPFFILGLARFLVKKNIRLIFWLVLPAVILYAVNFMIGNVAPIADWTPYL